MKFTTLDEMIRWINLNTDKTVVQKKDACATEAGVAWLHTADGTALLKSHGFVPARILREHLRESFRLMDDPSTELRRFYTLLENRLKSI